MRVSVIGGGRVTDEEAAAAERLGEILAERGHKLVCGGRGGVMEAACRGASEAGGHTIGILPTERRVDANRYVDTAIATGMGNARNVLVVVNGDAVVAGGLLSAEPAVALAPADAVDGGTGTLSELGHALDFGKPVAGLETHRIEGVDGIDHVDTPAAAVDSVERRV